MAKITNINEKSFLPPESVITFLNSNNSPKVITAGSYLVELDGSSSNDPDGTIISYQWERQKDGGDWEIQKTTTSFLYDQLLKIDGVYLYRLRCIDNEGLEGVSNELQVTFTKLASSTPTATINGSSTPVIDNTVQGNTFILDGSGSIAGNSGDVISSYSWRIVSSTDKDAINFQQASSSIANISSSETNTIEIELTVTNEGGLSDINTLTLTVTANFQ